MPQSSQFVGVNSVTNIELDDGVMPAPIIRNADWSEKSAWSTLLAASCCPTVNPEGASRTAGLSRVLILYRIVANCRFTSGNCIMRGYFRMDGRLVCWMGPLDPSEDSFMEQVESMKISARQDQT
jgi:hypothetical protein